MDEFDIRKPMNLRRRGIYLLPNLFTTGALFAGFYAIVQAMNLRFEFAAVAIFVAMVLDGLDGRVARLTHTQSEFGAEYDSLSDMVRSEEHTSELQSPKDLVCRLLLE